MPTRETRNRFLRAELVTLEWGCGASAVAGAALRRPEVEDHGA